MKDQYAQYLLSIDETETLYERVNIILHSYRKIWAEEVADIYLSEDAKTDAIAGYRDLWLYSTNIATRIELFKTEWNFEVLPIRDCVLRCQIKRRKYDFGNAVPESRLSVMVALDSGRQFELNASGVNCRYLKDIILKYFMANLRSTDRGH